MIDNRKQKEVEKRVTEYIQHHFSFIVFRLNDKEKRLELESKLISTITLGDECRPSPEWLGLSSPVDKIRESGLWNVRGLFGQPLSDGDYIELQGLVDRFN